MTDDATTVAPAGGRRHRHLHRLVPAAFVVLGLVGVAGALSLGLGTPVQPGPGLWPLVVAILLTLAAAVLVFRDEPAAYEAWTGSSVRVLLAGLSLVGFMVVMVLGGFFVACLLTLLLWLKVFARESWKWTIPLAVGGAAVFYLVFELLLAVPFPEPLVLGGLA
ncbi:tripartite tricarboxylate transporter TctB family protein [Mariniluteicoccus flavus]